MFIYQEGRFLVYSSVEPCLERSSDTKDFKSVTFEITAKETTWVNSPPQKKKTGLAEVVVSDQIADHILAKQGRVCGLDKWLCG